MTEPSAVFRNSWEERSRQQGALPGYLSTCMTFRCPAWWESIKDLRSQRAEEGLVHAGKGPRCEWEDVFSSALGTNWRHLRDGCETVQQWQRVLGFLSEIRQAGLRPDVITFSSLISACEKGQPWEPALGFL